MDAPAAGPYCAGHEPQAHPMQQMKHRTSNHKTSNHKTWNRKIWLLAAPPSLRGGAAAAETSTVGSIEIGNPWARATPKGASVGGAYMTITNKGTEPDRLV